MGPTVTGAYRPILGSGNKTGLVLLMNINSRECGPWTMCKQCDEIDVTIARYRRFKGYVTDQQMQKATDKLIAELEAKKAALHPE